MLIFFNLLNKKYLRTGINYIKLTRERNKHQLTGSIDFR